MNGGLLNNGIRSSCSICHDQVSSEFVRALDRVYHIQCFKCQDCDKSVVKKYFPAEQEDGTVEPAPLCETDYFRRLNLLCAVCQKALRGAYITACDRKYHIEHFTCSMCDHVFGPSDSYYEHENDVYCQKHYSQHFAAKCRGCTTAILRQFVEIFRNGSVQRWHPECYMIYKFLNVKLSGNVKNQDGDDAASADVLVEKASRIWTVLSGYEERAAKSISDMLLRASSGQRPEALSAGEELVDQVEVLFTAIDKLDMKIRYKNGKHSLYSREVRMLCKKMIAFFGALSSSDENNEGLNKELLTVVAGLAHYLKILMRVALTTALRLERDHNDLQSLRSLLNSLENYSPNTSLPLSAKVDTGGNLCLACRKSIEEDCFASNLSPRWHYNCLRCSECSRTLKKEYRTANWIARKQSVLCRECFHLQNGLGKTIAHVSKLQQYVFLVRIALSSAIEIVSNTSTKYEEDQQPFHVLETDRERKQGDEQSDEDTPPNSAVTAMSTGAQEFPRPRALAKENYSAQVDGERKKRVNQMDSKLAETAHTARQSRILNLPEGYFAPVVSSADEDKKQETRQEIKPQTMQQTDNHRHNDKRQSSTIFEVIDDLPVASNVAAIKPSRYLDDRSITLDDIQRVFVSQNFSGRKQPINEANYSEMKAAYQAKSPEGQAPQTLSPVGSQKSQQREDQFISELSAKFHFALRHVALAVLEPLLDQPTLIDDLLPLIETKKNTIWVKFGKAFRASGSDKKTAKKKGFFGLPLELLCEKYYAESVNGAGPSALRIPQLLDDIISVMRTKDLSAEGIFRKNGNIRKLNELANAIDRNPDGRNLDDEQPVQLAALMKKFLRELPEPLMMSRLHKIWLSSQSFEDTSTRTRILHYICCLLPKPNRDTMEVLFLFLQWVSSFSQVEEEHGSRMDAFNLATVMAPNILHNKGESVVEESICAVNVVHQLIVQNDFLSKVPPDIMFVTLEVLKDNPPSDISSKELLRICSEKCNSFYSGFNTNGEGTDINGTNGASRILQTSIEAR